MLVNCHIWFLVELSIFSQLAKATRIQARIERTDVETRASTSAMQERPAAEDSSHAFQRNASEISFGPDHGSWEENFTAPMTWYTIHGTPIATFWLVDPASQPQSRKAKKTTEKASYDNPFCGNWFPSMFHFAVKMPNGRTENYSVKNAEAAIFLAKANLLGDRERKKYVKELKRQNKLYKATAKTKGDKFAAIEYSRALQAWQRNEFSSHPQISKWFNPKVKLDITEDVLAQKFRSSPWLCSLINRYPAGTKFVEASAADNFFGVGMQASGFLTKTQEMGTTSGGDLKVLSEYGSVGTDGSNAHGIGWNILGVALTNVAPTCEGSRTKATRSKAGIEENDADTHESASGIHEHPSSENPKRTSKPNMKRDSFGTRHGGWRTKGTRSKDNDPETHESTSGIHENQTSENPKHASKPDIKRDSFETRHGGWRTKVTRTQARIERNSLGTEQLTLAMQERSAAEDSSHAFQRNASEVSFGPDHGSWEENFTAPMTWYTIHGNPIATFWLVDPASQPQSRRAKAKTEKASYDNPFCGNWFPSKFHFAVKSPSGQTEKYSVKNAEAAIFLAKANLLGDRERRKYVKELKRQNKLYNIAAKAKGDKLAAIEYSRALQVWQRNEFSSHPQISKWFDPKTKLDITQDVLSQKFQSSPWLCRLLNRYPAGTKFVEASAADSFFGVGMQASDFLSKAQEMGTTSEGHLKVMSEYGTVGMDGSNTRGIGWNILGVALTNVAPTCEGWQAHWEAMPGHAGNRHIR